jgi:phosphoribosylaminoimidazole (AIR) synthetase
MRRTFNLGIGLVFIVSPQDADKALRVLRRCDERPVVLGEVKKN